MRIAIAGRPGAGKSALFELLVHRAGPDGSDASGRGGLRTAHTEVPDPRVGELSQAYHPRKTILARLVFQDLEQKSGPVYPVLSSERRDMLAQSELILLVIDLYSCEPDEWKAEAVSQWRAALDEYTLCDLAVVETRRERLEKALKIGQKPNFPGESDVLARLHTHLEVGRPASEFPFTEDEEQGLRGYSFLSARPVLPAFNIDESNLAGATDALRGIAEEILAGDVATDAESRAASGPGRGSGAESRADAPWVLFCAEAERQIQELPPEDQAAFIEAFHLTEPAVAQIIRAAYGVAGLQSFFTVGDDEVRAWTVRRGATAPEAAGVIHSDLEKGFVRAEVLAYADWVQYGSHPAARDKGAVRLEGREYVVRDGDILNIRSGLARGGR
jgi:ribosome-binding ATPase YchF (GTP1/OBG family)